jgi:4-diphosphocytidyl-2-C-methyl-D-erythritol kinase
VDTAAAYRAWDAGARLEGGGGEGDDGGAGLNDLEAAAIAVVPALAQWRQAFSDATGARPRLAGSGAAWFVEDADGALAQRLGSSLAVGGAFGSLVPLRTVPAEGS